MAVNRPALPMTGGCPCGAIRYEITLFPRLLYCCNCTDCQRASGSAFALNMPVLSRGFRILHGDPRAWHHRSPRGVEVTSRFCGDCGGRLYGERSGRAESLNLRAGTLDDTSWLMPVAQIFGEARNPGSCRRSMPNATTPNRPTSPRCCRRGARCGRSSFRRNDPAACYEE